VAWGSRLAVFTAWRGAGQGEDPRYRDLLRRARRHPDRYALRVIYLPQGLILWLATAPVQAGMLAARPADAVTVAGAVLWLAGFAFETTGDCQLARFKSRPRDSGSIMDRGLWRYTRHPNYFGDACMWWGLYLAAYGGWPWLPGALAPLAMTFLLVRGTGQRLTERRMAGRPGYAAYIRRTSGFFPLPPRVVAAARRRRPPR
jgi:steroid 5-alpha reductase family enzyme